MRSRLMLQAKSDPWQAMRAEARPLTDQAAIAAHS